MKAHAIYAETAVIGTGNEEGNQVFFPSPQGAGQLSLHILTVLGADEKIIGDDMPISLA